MTIQDSNDHFESHLFGNECIVDPLYSVYVTWLIHVVHDLFIRNMT